MVLTKHDLFVYQTRAGKSPYREWFNHLKDEKDKDRIRARLTRVEVGHWGDYKYLSQGLFEFRLHFGPGYRIYFGKDKNRIVLLLCGGDKSSQKNDLKMAKAYWQDYQERQA